MQGLTKKGLLAAVAAGSMIFGSTAAVAATAVPATRPSAWLALSALSGGASTNVACGASQTNVADGATGGCELAMADQAADTQSAPPQPIPVPPVEPASAGLGVSPLVIGLVAVLAGVGLYLVLHHGGNDHSNSPA